MERICFPIAFFCICSNIHRFRPVYGVGPPASTRKQIRVVHKRSTASDWLFMIPLPWFNRLLQLRVRFVSPLTLLYTVDLLDFSVPKWADSVELQSRFFTFRDSLHSMCVSLKFVWFSQSILRTVLDARGPGKLNRNSSWRLFCYLAISTKGTKSHSGVDQMCEVRF